MGKRRRFTPEFRVQVVLELLSGSKSMAEVCREHRLASQVVSAWSAPDLWCLRWAVTSMSRPSALCHSLVFLAMRPVGVARSLEGYTVALTDLPCAPHPGSASRER